MPASNYLVGTAPDQVPSNADLGEMAFQSKDAVEFTGGKGGLSHLDVTAISALLNVTATDVFVYDTSKDSDGGAWRSRCQHTSWYNETLNTATRGSRREFPSVAVLVVDGTYLRIHDGDDPLLPMWMILQRGSTAHSYYSCSIFPDAGSLVAVVAVNGIIAVAQNGDQKGVTWVKFIEDAAYTLPTTYWGYGKFNGNIAQRTTYLGYGVINEAIKVVGTGNDVAMTVLPNAPIDAATGLPIPTIALATEGGVSVVNNDGSVANLTNEDPSYNATRYIQFNQKRQLQFVMDAVQRYLRTFNPPFAARTVSQWGAQYDDGITVGLEIPQFTASASYIRDIAENAIATDLGVEVFFENTSNPSASLYAYIAAKYNSGWLVGDIKGAWLSDTTQETVVGTELVTNGTFASDINGWTASGDSVTWSSGKIRITRTTTLTTATQQVNVVAGKTYAISGDISNISGGGAPIIRFSSGAFSGTYYITDLVTTGSNVAYWTATFTGTAYIGVGVGTTSGVWEFDNISVRLADPDRSVNNKGLQVFGSITKTPVATGADLVAYSGFSSNSNYLRQPYNSGLDFGTSDFCYTWWANVSAAASYQAHFCREYHNGGNFSGPSIEVFTESTSGYLRIYLTDDGYATYDVWNSNATTSGKGWQHFAIVRRINSIYVYINGVLDNVKNLVEATASLSNSNASLYVGCQANLQSGANTTSIAMLRASGTAPSPEQIAKMYNDEKFLFQDNAKATLYGTSDAVTALAYDEDTQLLHVGTSSGRSVFDGLRRVDSTTTAVSATISAANGLVVEN